MGWNPFKRKKTVQVASTLYSFSGDYDKNDDGVKVVVLSSILRNTNIAENLVNYNLYGPYFSIKQFLKWCNRTDYPGNIVTKVFKKTSVNSSVVKPFLTYDPELICNVEKTFIDTADITTFVDKYLLENNPSQRFTSWIAELFTPTVVKITYVDLSTELINLPLDFDTDNQYLVCYYKLFEPSSNDALIEGAEVTSSTLPDTSDFSLVSTINVSAVTVNLTVTTEVSTVYSNEFEPEYTSDVVNDSDIFIGNTTVKEKIEYLGVVTNATTSYIEHKYYQTKIYTIEENIEETVDVIDHGTYTETVTTTVTTQYLSIAYEYRFDEQTFYDNIFVEEKVFIYLVGSGNEELDALVANTDIGPEFYPVIPLRLNNNSIRNFPVRFPAAKEAYKRLSKGSKLEKVLDLVEDNANIGDLDYVYIHLGVALNTTSKYELRYIYEFFKSLISYQNLNVTDYEEWLNSTKDNDDYLVFYETWLAAQNDPLNPLYKTPRPTNSPVSNTTQAHIVPPQINEIFFRTSNNDGFRIRLVWYNISETIHTGLGREGAKRGDLWWVTENSELQKIWYDLYPTGDTEQEEGISGVNQSSLLYYQVGTNTYKVLKIHGMEHRNYVYRGKYVSTHIKDALADPDKSGFVVPLHDPTLKALLGTYRNEVVSRCQHLLFNTYKIYKQKWYQTTFFKILFIVYMLIVIIVVTIFTWGAGTAPTTAAVASVLGVTLATASITVIILVNVLAFAVNMLVATVIQYILEETLQLFLDDELAALLSTIATMVIMAGINSPGEGFSSALTTFFADPTNILLLTINVANAGLEYINTLSIKDSLSDVQSAQDTLNKNEELIKKNTDLLGLSRDSSLLSQEIQDIIIFPETRSNFLNRSLLTGSDIVNSSLSLITNFVDHALNNHKLNI